MMPAAGQVPRRAGDAVERARRERDVGARALAGRVERDVATARRCAAPLLVACIVQPSAVR